MINPRLIEAAARFLSDKLTHTLANNPTFIKFVHRSNETISKTANQVMDEVSRAAAATAAANRNGNNNNNNNNTTTTNSQQQQHYSTYQQQHNQQQQTNNVRRRSVVGVFGEELWNEIKSLNPFSSSSSSSSSSKNSTTK